MRTFGACGGVRTHPVHPPWLRACIFALTIFISKSVDIEVFALFFVFVDVKTISLFCYLIVTTDGNSLVNGLVIRISIASHLGGHSQYIQHTLIARNSFDSFRYVNFSRHSCY